MATHKPETDIKENALEAYREFFLELPPTEYLEDIEIQDDYEKTTDYTVRGLSDEQVSQIAQDSLAEANLPDSQNEKSEPTAHPPRDS